MSSPSASVALPAEKQPQQQRGMLGQWVDNLTQHENFRRFARFGLVDQSFLIMGLLSGFQLDAVFTRAFGVRGYGPILGAAVGNCAADVIASAAEGRHAMAGIMIGTFIPLTPLIGAMVFKVPIQGRAQYVLGGICLGIIGGTFYKKPTRDHELTPTDNDSEDSTSTDLLSDQDNN